MFTRRNILFVLVILAEFIGSAFLTYQARHTMYPESMYYLGGVIFFCGFGLTFGSATLISSVLGILIGFFI